MSMKRHKEFIEMLQEYMVINENKDINQMNYKAGSDVLVGNTNDLQAELERKFDELFGTLNTN